MTNPKIEKVDVAIAKTKAKIAEYQAKLRDLERQRIVFEDAEIVAMFRKEKLTEDDIAALVRKKSDGSVTEQSIETGYVRP